MEFLLFGLILLGIPFVLPIGLWVYAARTRSRVVELERVVEQQKAVLHGLSELVQELRREARAEPARAPAAEAPAAQAPAAEAPRPAPPPRPTVPPPVPPPPAPVVERPWPDRPPVPAPPPQPEPPRVVERPWPEDAPRVEKPPVAPPAAAPPPSMPAPQPAPRVEPRPAAAAPPPPVRRGPAVPPPPPVPPEPERSFDWESLVGVKLFSAIAGVALVLAAIFFLRYSVQQGWLQPPVRVLIGIIVGIALLVVCEMKAARKYPVTANALDAAAIAILFSTFFAAHALWNLIPAGVTFGLLALVTAVAVLLSIRRESLFIAVLGLLGGFATPALLSTGENRPIPLFAYLLLLNVGLAWVAYRQTWPVLSVLTLALTTIYQWGWVFKFLAASDLPLAMGIFLVFPVVTLAGLLLARRDAQDDSTGAMTFERTAMTAAAMPLLFAVYLAAVPGYGARPGLLFGFLLLVDAGLLAISVARRETNLHAVGALATVLVSAVWLAASYHSDSRWLVLAFTSAFVILYLAGPPLARAFSRDLEGPAERAIYAAPTLLLVFAVLARLEPAFGPAPLPFFAVLLALVLLCAWAATATQQAFVYFVASFFAVGAQAVWSTTHLTIGRLRTAVVVYAVFGVVNALVPVVARRTGRPLEPAGASGVALLASLGLLVFLSIGPVAPAALWALALLLAIMNAGLFIESASARLPVLAQAGTVLSWAILANWWMRAAASVGLLPSLAVVTGLTLLTLGGHGWASRAAPSDGHEDTLRFRDGLYLGLIGHLFLLFVALNRQWSIPPWPLFGTLGVITLATSTASLVTRAGALHASGTIAASLIVAAWAFVAGVSPWPTTGVAASGAVSLFALAWIAAARRVGAPRGAAVAAAAALFMSQLTVMIATASPGRPAFVVILSAHVLTLAVLLALTWAERWRHVAFGVAGVAWLGLLEWQSGFVRAHDWRELLVLSGALYALFTVYPLVVGPKAPGDREPWLVALAGAAMAFFAARDAFEAGGLEWMVGVVPVAQGIVTALLLRALLRLERPGERDLGRLALMAGAALAFVTVAIPLQLEHQWITIGWALEGAALAWVYTRIPHKGLLLACAGLCATVFVRLALNPAVFVYEPRGATRIFNWYLYTYLIAAAALMLAAWWLYRTEDRIVEGLPRLSHILPAAGTILLFLLLNIEIADYFATGPEITFRFGAGLSQDLTYTIGWLAFGMAMLAAGIYMRARPARVTAVALIAVTTFKCFLYDLRSLEGLYRVASFVGLALSLALVSLALQKYVLAKPRGTA